MKAVTSVDSVEHQSKLQGKGLPSLAKRLEGYWGVLRPNGAKLSLWNVSFHCIISLCSLLWPSIVLIIGSESRGAPSWSIGMLNVPHVCKPWIMPRCSLCKAWPALLRFFPNFLKLWPTVGLYPHQQKNLPGRSMLARILKAPASMT